MKHAVTNRYGFRTVIKFYYIFYLGVKMLDKIDTIYERYQKIGRGLKMITALILNINTVELEWLEHLWDHKNYM